MTQRLYLHSDDLHMDSVALRCTRTDEGHYQVVLSATLFHPQGGGQPSDIGTIGAANVLRALLEGDEVIHICDAEVPLGSVPLRVDAEARDLHTRLHSAGHLLGYCGEQLGWKPVKAHHWPGEARVVFESHSAAPPFSAEFIEQHANAQVADDLPRHSQFEGAVRKIGFGAQPAYPCGGTHVDSSARVGKIVVSKVKEKKGQLSVHYAIE
ncbi:Ser-tRNA(Ala) deacylase AlaX [Paraburkholderia tropica]|uniref:alanyl-tRNA editing protein n=1 Tax=Paraburkholderia tropica TaxID=92647 RepID=UPI001CAF7018|nr:alanyl-tRNA editing protein [Paraburkholderia tropica]CAG9233063.1 Ser-tRNA(Ala) deacylase AlaX [Paraburkholderia tropica]